MFMQALLMRPRSCAISLCGNVRHLGISMKLLEILFVARGRCFDRLVTGIPVRRADLVKSSQHLCVYREMRIQELNILRRTYR